MARPRDRERAGVRRARRRRRRRADRRRLAGARAGGTRATSRRRSCRRLRAEPTEALRSRRARTDDGSVGGDQLRAHDVVAGEAELRRQVADAAAHREPAHAGRSDDAARSDEAVTQRRAVEVEPRRTATGASRPRSHVDLDAAQRARDRSRSLRPARNGRRGCGRHLGRQPPARGPSRSREPWRRPAARHSARSRPPAIDEREAPPVRRTPSSGATTLPASDSRRSLRPSWTRTGSAIGRRRRYRSRVAPPDATGSRRCQGRGRGGHRPGTRT